MNVPVIRSLFYPSLLWNIILSKIIPRREWWNEIYPHVILGALPFPHLTRSLKRLGVTAIVNMCEEWPGPCDLYKAEHITQLHLPTTDFRSPLIKDIEKGINFIEEHRANGSSVYVHCKAGKGRSATLILCWLIAVKGMTPEDAQEYILQRRPHVSKYLYRRDVVQEFQKNQMINIKKLAGS
ncbi:MAG: dual specificity protein phosphatase family protein [Candidatus Scalindua sp.]|nr:dual specificity protein phosphatase family protein [Candidatus Scalindua sp.]